MNKLKIYDIAVGDWVSWNEKTYRVCLIDGISLTVELAEELGGTIEVAIDELSGIPLTAEILERNGFRRSVDYSGNNRTPYIFRRGKKKGPFDKVTVNLFHPTDKRLFRRGVYHELVYESPMFAGHWNFAYVKYVHQLQHAIRLAGIEKEIEL